MRNLRNCCNCSMDKDINKLSTFLMKEYPGEISENKSAVDISIELLKKKKRA